jgi:hypothetical protein
MRRSTPLALLGAVALGVAGVALPAQADPGPGPNTSVAIHLDALGAQPAQDYAGDSGPVYVSGNERHVSLSVLTGGRWNVEVSAPAGRTLSAGESFAVASSDALSSDSEPGLRVLEWDGDENYGRWLHCGDSIDNPPERPVTSLGRFTVQQAVYDGAGHPVQFAVTFEQNCQDTEQPSLEGSMAVTAADPAAPVPTASATPGPLTGVTITNHAPNPDRSASPDVYLSWTKPEGTPSTRTVISFAQPAPFLTNILSYTTIYDGTDSSYVAPYWYEGISSYGFRLVPVSALGRLGTPTVVQLQGTRFYTKGSPRRLVMGQKAVLTGRLSKSLADPDVPDTNSGPGLVGRRIDIYSRPRTADGRAPWVLEGHTTTGADGRYEAAVAPRENSWYGAVFSGSSVDMANGDGVPFNVDVAPRTDLASNSRQVRRHSKITLSTSRSTAGSRSIVLLQRYSAHAWHTVATRRIKPAVSGRTPQRQVLRYRVGARGTYVFRLAKPGDAKHVTGYSRTVRVKVR